ncbi:hypothetical protein H4R19_000338 [Coemansia spiralis]|nr:hypothetical protein H4R19_000338 [Coemansia spiralis]
MKFASIALALTFTAAVARPVPDGLLGGVVDAVAPITAGLGEVLNKLLGFDNGAGFREDSGSNMGPIFHPGPGPYDVDSTYIEYGPALSAPQANGPYENAGHPLDQNAHVVISHDMPPAHQAIVFKAVY